MFIIGENNTSDNLLSGFINRYKDNSNNFKFTGLVRNTDSDKSFLLVNDINADTSNKNLDINNFNNISTNTSNNYKNNYSSLYLNKLKSLSTNQTSSNVSSIYTKGSLGVSKNVYLGDINNVNSRILIGDNTMISYRKDNADVFSFNTNVKTNIKTTNSKDINIESNQNFSFTINNNFTQNINRDFSKSISANNNLVVDNVINEIYKKNLYSLVQNNHTTIKGPYGYDSPVPKPSIYKKTLKNLLIIDKIIQLLLIQKKLLIVIIITQHLHQTLT